MPEWGTEKKELTNTVVYGLFGIQIMYLPVGIIKYIIYNLRYNRVSRRHGKKKEKFVGKLFKSYV